MKQHLPWCHAASSMSVHTCCVSVQAFAVIFSLSFFFFGHTKNLGICEATKHRSRQTLLWVVGNIGKNYSDCTWTHRNYRTEPKSWDSLWTGVHIIVATSASLIRHCFNSFWKLWVCLCWNQLETADWDFPLVLRQRKDVLQNICRWTEFSGPSENNQHCVSTNTGKICIFARY